jgi:hypothetical protein
MEAAFREDDARLLARIEDEVVAGAIWARQAGVDAPRLPARSAGMISLLRSLPGGAAAIERALAGDLAPVLALLVPESVAGWPPALVHHSAVHFARVATALSATDAEASDAAWLRSLGAWLALGEERRYLEGLARVVAGSGLAAAEAEAAGRGVALRSLDELGAAARAGAADHTEEGRRALAMLGRTDRAARIGGLDVHAATRVKRRADTMRGAAISAALAPTLEALADASARDAIVREAPEIFERVRRIWIWSDRDEQVERFAVDEATALAWIAYRETGWDPLRAIVAPLAEMTDRMAARIAEDPRRHLAYTAKCAQFLVFRGECEKREADRWPLVERALTICPSHRNARVVACNFLCDRADVLLSGNAIFQGSALALAEQAVERAETLFPQSKRLEKTKARLDEIRGRNRGFSR